VNVRAHVFCVALVAGTFISSNRLLASEEVKAAAVKKPAVAKAVAVGENKRRAAGVVLANDGAAVLGTGILPEAYNLLKLADHDYKGHRARAMHQIEMAARLIGEHLAGDGHAREPQPTSDANLRRAQSLLSEAVSKMAGTPAVHIQKATQELSVALAVR